MYRKEKKNTSEKETSDIVELRSKSKPLNIDIKTKSEKYNSGGGTPDLVSKLSLNPKFSIESKGMPIHGTQAQVGYALIRTESFDEINIVRKKERNAGDYSLNNEIEKSQSIKKHADYEKIKNHLSLPFFTVNRNSGQEIYLRLKKNGDLESHRNFIQSNSSSDEGIDYIFHQTRNIVKTLNFLHNGDFLDEKEKMHKGIIHGDIKPDNILIDKNGDLSLSDFGCARYADEPIGQLGLVTYLSPELLKMYAGKIPSSSNPGKSDIWSLGLTLQSTLTGKCPIESYIQTTIEESMNSMSKDTSGYFTRQIKPTSVAQEIHTEEQAEWLEYLEKLNYPTIEQEPLQVRQIRIKVDEYLQSETCKKNLESKKIIQDLCQNSSHVKIDKRVVLGHLTSSMLLPEEQRPTAENLNETMDNLAHYFPYDQKNNKFVKKMTREESSPSLISQKENTHPIKKQVNFTLSSNRASHKELLDKVQGATSVSFLYSHTTQKNKTEKNKSNIDNKNPIMTMKK